ncbi:MAG: glycosyl transferase family protein [Gallionellaceae bacterium]|nr:glycosyl transferase family protein [Gallionellaceae bacterium]
MTHPFAEYVRILGKGHKGTRDLTQAEAAQALSMILAREAEPVQVGAFLMLMRVKEETGAEIAGFASAARASLNLPTALPEVALDWPSYAGKRRQLPWFVLSALLLAGHGVPVLMHGIGGGTAGRVYVPDALAALGIAPCASPEHAAQQIKKTNFAYLPLAALNPELQRLLDLKATLGLRSPMHTTVRMLNPFGAPASIAGIFHPGYDDLHQQAGALLGMKNLAVFKGEGGEAERNPDAVCNVKMLVAGEMVTEDWPALFSARHLKDDAMEVERMGSVWRGEMHDEYGEAAVIATAAIALRVLGRADTSDAAMKLARELWRDRSPLPLGEG